jgi:5-methylcytosine-specific restriction endonuclease McrA
MDTLVLSASYQPVDRISWQRAICLWVMEKVEILEQYEDREVRSVSMAIKMPSVVRFLQQTRIRKGSVKFSRENVYTRDKGRCQYCGAKVPRMEATYDHVIPRRLGGQTRWDNIVIACYDCNQQKGGRTPQAAGMRLIAAPAKPKTLPPTFRVTLSQRTGVPASWKQYLVDVAYWHGALDED